MVERQLGPQVAVSGKSRSSSLAYEPTDLRYQRTLPAALALAFDMQSVRMAGDNAWLSSTFDIFLPMLMTTMIPALFRSRKGGRLALLSQDLTHRLLIV